MRALPRDPSGLYWGRWRDVPDGIRVQVWLHGVDGRMRGTWELPPWHGEITGLRARDGTWDVLWREEGVVSVLSARARRLRLRRDAHDALRGEDVSLTPARATDVGLRGGVWLARWTGLPHGMAVETVLSTAPDGRWRAAYTYQEREGAFDGELQDGALAIRWREVSSTGTLAQGRGRLRPTLTGLSGTYGVNDEEAGTGFWSLEPAE